MSLFDKQEFRLIEDLNKNLSNINNSIKDFTKTVKHLSSRTNQNTLMFRLVEAVKGIGKEIKDIIPPKK